ncbi:hypothetical protein PI124_g928 [Phytophthora idaei]|nr:hypothetical protein PI124_g928 [Phytophthora idaei]
MSEGSKERSSASFINLLRYFEKSSMLLLSSSISARSSAVSTESPPLTSDYGLFAIPSCHSAHSSLTVETHLLIEYCGGSGHSTPAASDPAGSLTGSRRNVMFPCSIESAV